MLFERADDRARSFVRMIIGAVEFLVGDRAGRGSDRLTIHAASDREQGPRAAVDLPDDFYLRCDRGAIDLDDACIIGAAVARDLLDQIRRNGDVGNVLTAAGADALHRGVIFKAQGDPLSR